MELVDSILAFAAVPVAQSIEAKTLVPATEKATREAGFQWPVLFSAAAHARHVAVGPAAETMLCDAAGREWDVLWTLKIAVKTVPENTTAFRFVFGGVTEEGGPRRSHRCDLIGLLVMQDDEPNIFLVTPEEALGEDVGSLICRYGRLLADSDGEEVEDLGDEGF